MFYGKHMTQIGRGAAVDLHLSRESWIVNGPRHQQRSRDRRPDIACRPGQDVAYFKVRRKGIGYFELYIQPQGRFFGNGGFGVRHDRLIKGNIIRHVRFAQKRIAVKAPFPKLVRKYGA